MESAIKVRRSAERGRGEHDWLRSLHTFSFADYYDQAHMGFRSLRVINEDWVQPAMGFGMHPHRDMEIITIVLQGALEHKDSMGNSSVIRPGDLQRMSAGTGITHSEFNHSTREPVHLLQIWILPAARGLAPGYEQKNFLPDQDNELKLLASADARSGSVMVHQDVDLYHARLSRGGRVSHTLKKARGVWVQVTRGQINLNGVDLNQGDGAAIEAAAATPLHMKATEAADLLLFDLN